VAHLTQLQVEEVVVDQLLAPELPLVEMVVEVMED